MATQLAIPQSLAQPEVVTSPFDYYAVLREQAPVHFDAQAGFYIITRYEDILSVLRQPLLFSSELGFKAQQAGPYAEEVNQILETEGLGADLAVFTVDPPYHDRIRAVVSKAFAANRVTHMEDGIDTAAKELIAKFPDDGVIDLVEGFSVPLPVMVIADILGVDPAYRSKFRRWSDAVLAPMSGHLSREESLAYARDVCELQHFLNAELKDRLENRREDMMSDLLHAHEGIDVAPLSFPELFSVVRTLLVAGNETTETTISHGLLLLATRPDLIAKLRASENLDRACLRFAEELLRMQPAAMGVPRVPVEDVTIADVLIPKGSMVYLALSSANRDENRFEDPNGFDLERGNLSQHLTFGAGIRRCVGALLARAEIKCAIKNIVESFESLELQIPASQVQIRPHLLTRKILELPTRVVRR